MPEQNWPLAVPPPGFAAVAAAAAAVAVGPAAGGFVAPALGVVVLLPHALTATAKAATNSGSLYVGLFIPLTLLRVPAKPSALLQLDAMRFAPL